MSDNTSVIDAVRRIAKATKEDPDGTSDIVKGALHPEQIDDVRIMLSRARTGSLQGAATSSTAAAAPAATSKAGAAQRDTSVQRRQWRTTPNKASAKYQQIPPANTEANFPPLASSAPSWGSANRVASRPRPSRREQTPHPTLFATDAEIAAMTPDQRALHDAEVSLQRQKRDMELRHEAETQSSLEFWKGERRGKGGAWQAVGGKGGGGGLEGAGLGEILPKIADGNAHNFLLNFGRARGGGSGGPGRRWEERGGEWVSVEEDMVNRFRASIRESSRPPARPQLLRRRRPQVDRPPRLHSKPLFSGHGGPRGCRYLSSTPIGLLRLVWKRGPREGSALTRLLPSNRGEGRYR